MKTERLCGIYKITSPKGRIYIGQCVDSISRWNSYKNMKCERQPLLYKSFLKYGVENHSFEMIHILNKDGLTKCEIKEELNILEISYIKKMSSFKVKGNNGLNLTTGGHSTEFSEESIKKISDKAKGRKVSPKTIAKIVAKTTGQKRSDDTKNKISEKLTGREFSEEHKKNISNAKKGVKSKNPMSKETKLKISIAHKGKKKNPEAIKKSANSKRGKKQSEAAKLKKSIASKGEKNPNYGKKRSPEVNAKILASFKRNRALIEEEKRMMVF
jgi:group I intron endonuclease